MVTRREHSGSLASCRFVKPIPEDARRSHWQLDFLTRRRDCTTPPCWRWTHGKFQGGVKAGSTLRICIVLRFSHKPKVHLSELLCIWDSEMYYLPSIYAVDGSLSSRWLIGHSKTETASIKNWIGRLPLHVDLWTAASSASDVDIATRL